MCHIAWQLVTKRSVMPITLDEIRGRTYKQTGLNRATICLSGPDGIGKTTHAILLKQYFEKRSLRTKIIWGRWPAFFSYGPIFLGKLLGLNKRLNTKESRGRIVTHEYYKMPPIAKLWSMLMIVDIIFYNFLRLKIAKIQHNIIILDRFILDILVDIMYETKNPKLSNSMLGTVYIKVANKFSINLILDAPSTIPYLRKAELTISELEQRRKLYQKFGNMSKSKLINASGPISLTHKRIIDAIKYLS